MASKAGSTDRRVVNKRGRNKQTWHIKASSFLLQSVGDKDRKNWIILLPDLQIQLGRGKTVPGNNLSSHDLNLLWTRTAGHALDPVLHHGDEQEDFSNALLLHCHPFWSLFVIIFCMECLHFYTAFVCVRCGECMQTHLIPTFPFSVDCHFLIRIREDLEPIQAVTM